MLWLPLRATAALCSHPRSLDSTVARCAECVRVVRHTRDRNLHAAVPLVERAPDAANRDTNRRVRGAGLRSGPSGVRHGVCAVDRVFCAVRCVVWADVCALGMRAEGPAGRGEHDAADADDTAQGQGNEKWGHAAQRSSAHDGK